MVRMQHIEAAQFNALCGVVAALGEALATMERIVNTPMPMPYLVHLRQVIILFLVILPLQVRRHAIGMVWHGMAGLG